MRDNIYMFVTSTPVVNQLSFAVLVMNYQSVGDLKAPFYE